MKGGEDGEDGDGIGRLFEVEKEGDKGMEDESESH